MPDGALARPRVLRGGAKRRLLHARRVFRFGFLPDTGVVPADWTADRQIQGALSNSARPPLGRSVEERSGGMDGSSPVRLPLCCPRLCRAPGPQQPEGSLARNRTGSGPRNTLADRCQRPGAGLGPASLDRLARSLRMLTARRMIPSAGRKAGRPDRPRGVLSGKRAAAASPFGGLLDESTEVLPSTAATKMAAVSLGSSYRRRHRCEHCLCLFATADLVNLRLCGQRALGATGEPAA